MTERKRDSEHGTDTKGQAPEVAKWTIGGIIIAIAIFLIEVFGEAGLAPWKSDVEKASNDLYRPRLHPISIYTASLCDIGALSSVFEEEPKSLSTDGNKSRLAKRLHFCFGDDIPGKELHELLTYLRRNYPNCLTEPRLGAPSSGGDARWEIGLAEPDARRYCAVPVAKVAVRNHSYDIVDEDHDGWRILCFDGKANPVEVGSTTLWGGVPKCRWHDLVSNGISIPTNIEERLKNELPE